MININVSAKSNVKYVIPGGESIGLQISTGVLITGKFDVKTKTGIIKPWENSNIEVNDMIYSINGNNVESIQDIQKIISKLSNEEIIEFIVIRNGQKIATSIKTAENIDGKLSLGLYVKDKILGVGTLTYIDPLNRSFASLGHSVFSKNSEYSNSFKNDIKGEIVSSKVNGIRKAIPGTPGEKRAILEDEVKGIITKNNDFGVFGLITDEEALRKEKVAVGQISEIKKGKANIITVTSNKEKKKYEIEIVELKNQVLPDVKGIKFKVTDKELLDTTGGIIQGMSGSPIMQNGKIIGAVSHVIVDSPEYGYGVYLEWMLKNS